MSGFFVTLVLKTVIRRGGLLDFQNAQALNPKILNQTQYNTDKEK